MYFASLSAFAKDKTAKFVGNWSENEARYIFMKIKNVQCVFRGASFFTISRNKNPTNISTYTVLCFVTITKAKVKVQQLHANVYDGLVLYHSIVGTCIDISHISRINAVSLVAKKW